MIDLIRALLQEWENKKLPDIIRRDIDLTSYAEMNVNKIIVITGFRRTGKTYLLLGLIKHLLEKKEKKQIIYLNFEDERIPIKIEFLTGLIPSIKQLASPEFLFLDELQTISQWSRWLRRIYDTGELRIFVTGSSSKMSSKEIPTELRGRFLEIEVLPLSFKEFLSFKKVELKRELSEQSKIILMKALNEYIQFGGMPEVVLAPEAKKSELLLSYFNTVVRRDIIEKYHIRNEESLRALLKLLLNATSFTISKFYNTLKSLNLEVGKGTVQHYLKIIESSYLIYVIPYFSYKVKDQMQYPRKIYFVDTGLANFLSTNFSSNMGRNYEHSVFLELKRRRKEIYYWKSTQHYEVDFLIQEGNSIQQLIQVCYNIEDYDTKKIELKALLKASKELKCNNLLIITESKEGKEIVKGKKIFYVPLWKWLLQEKSN